MKNETMAVAATPVTEDTIRAAFAKDSSQMTSVLARSLGVTEADVFAALTGVIAQPLDASRREDIFRAFESLGRVHAIVSNETTTIECVGEFGGFSTWGEYFNVRSDSLDMHIRAATIQSIFAVRKPSHMDGVVTLSVQFFNASGAAALKVFLTFGQKPPTEDRLAQFDALCERFAAT